MSGLSRTSMGIQEGCRELEDIIIYARSILAEEKGIPYCLSGRTRAVPMH